MRTRGSFMRRSLVFVLVTAALPALAGGAANSGVVQGVQLRQNLEGVLTEYEAIVENAPVQPEILAMLHEARLRLAEVPDQELELWAPEIATQVERLREAASRFRATLRTSSPDATVMSPGLPAADYPEVQWSFAVDAFTDIGDIPSSAGDTEVSGLCNYLTAPTPNQQFLYLNLEIAAAALRDTADRLCSFVASIVGEGGSLSLVCIVTDLLYMVEKSIKENVFLCGTVMGEAEMRASYFRIGHIHDDLTGAQSNLHSAILSAEQTVNAELGETQTLILGVSNDLQLHDENLTDHANAVDAELAAHLQALESFRLQSLRHHIEQRLSEADHGPMALFFLPDTVGGQIETVRDIVEETIGEAAAAGRNVRQAEQLFAAADDALSQQEFKVAYDLFGRAYRAALQ